MKEGREPACRTDRGKCLGLDWVPGCPCEVTPWDDEPWVSPWCMAATCQDLPRHAFYCAPAALSRKILGTFCVHLCAEHIAVWSRRPGVSPMQAQSTIRVQTAVSEASGEGRALLLDQREQSEQTRCALKVSPASSASVSHQFGVRHLARWLGRALLITVTAAVWHCSQQTSCGVLLLQNRNNPLQGQIRGVALPGGLRPL